MSLPLFLSFLPLVELFFFVDNSFGGTVNLAGTVLLFFPFHFDETNNNGMLHYYCRLPAPPPQKNKDCKAECLELGLILDRAGLVGRPCLC